LKCPREYAVLGVPFISAEELQKLLEAHKDDFEKQVSFLLFYTVNDIFLSNKNSAIEADMAAQSCTIRIFAVECGIPVFNPRFLGNL